MLKVSVILPTHDRPDSLERAVRSVLTQTLPPEELVIVNDGASEIPGHIADDAKVAGVRLVSMRSSVASLPRSRNLGVSGSTGDVIVFAEDDLLFPPDYVARLVELYDADAEGVVGGIGAVVQEAQSRGLRGRLWDLLCRLLGHECWRPRQCAARYVRLPSRLRGRLVAAQRLSGGGMSLRRKVLSAERFDEAMGGYALGEDLAFSYRAGRRHALFVAPQLSVLHAASGGGRPDMKARGRMYVANSLYIARSCVEGGAGTWLLVGLELAGTLFQYVAWGLLGCNRGALRFAAGAAAELARAAGKSVRNMLCGC